MLKNKLISLNDCIMQSTGNIVSNMDGEKVMLSIMNGKYYNLGEVGGIIWEKIEEPSTVNHIVQALMSEYSVEQAVCEDQVISFLEALLKQNLVQVKE